MQKIIRKSQLKEITGLSPRHIDRLEKAGKFPTRIQLSLRAVGWYEDEIIQWLNTRPRGPAVAPLSDIESSTTERPPSPAGEALHSFTDPEIS